MFEFLPTWMTSAEAGWGAFISLLLTVVFLYLTGKIVAGTIAEMWKSAYESERDANIKRREAGDEEHQATMATFIHLLRSIQGPPDGEDQK